jgi:hypothetical protein
MGLLGEWLGRIYVDRMLSWHLFSLAAHVCFAPPMLLQKPSSRHLRSESKKRKLPNRHYE